MRPKQAEAIINKNIVQYVGVKCDICDVVLRKIYSIKYLVTYSL